VLIAYTHIVKVHNCFDKFAPIKSPVIYSVLNQTSVTVIVFSLSHIGQIFSHLVARHLKKVFILEADHKSKSKLEYSLKKGVQIANSTSKRRGKSIVVKTFSEL
jgi:hypothetical protein